MRPRTVAMRSGESDFFFLTVQFVLPLVSSIRFYCYIYFRIYPQLFFFEKDETRHKSLYLLRYSRVFVKDDLFDLCCPPLVRRLERQLADCIASEIGT